MTDDLQALDARLPSEPSFFQRFGRIVLIVVACCVPVGIWAALCVLDRIDNNVSVWLPTTSPAVRDFQEFQRAFGGEDVIAVSWPGCDLNDKRLTRFTQSLAQAAVIRDGEPRPLFRKVVSGQEMIELLTGPPMNIDRDIALERLRGITLGDDLNSTCAIAIPAGREALDSVAILDEIRRCAISIDGLDPHNVAVVGTPLFILHMNQETKQLIWLAAMAASIGLLLAWWHLRTLRFVMSLFLSSLIVTGAGMIALYVAGTPMNALLILLPALWFILSVSASIHLINYFQDAAREGESKPVERAVARGFAPTALATFTTAIGLATLTVSNLGPVRAFGLFGALGLVNGLVVLFVLLPSLIEHWPEARQSALPIRSNPRSRESWLWDMLTEFLNRRHRAVVFAFFAFMVFLAGGVLRTRVAADQLDYFRPDSALIQNFEWFEERIGPLIPIELTVRFPPGNRPAALIDRIHTIGDLAKQLAESDPEITTFSAASLVPKVPSRGELSALTFAEKVRAGVERRIQTQHIEENKSELVDGGYLFGEGDSELWRITVRTTATSDAHYKQFVESVRATVSGILSDGQADAADLDVTFTGTPILSMRIRQDLWEVLTKSFLLSFVVISLVMAIALRSLVGGTLAMGPNVFPLLLSFGVMGWLAVSLDIGSVMTVSVALGIAVDDTFHYLIWFRRGRVRGLSQVESVRWAYQNCGAAMVQTSLICGLSMLVFALSGFVPASRFGVLMSLMLGAALFGDLILLPALLIGPAGRQFASNDSGDIPDPRPAFQTVSSESAQ